MKKYLVYALMGMIGLFCFVAIFITPSFGDELNYHYPLARQISCKQILDPNSDYSSAYGPLPYLIGNVFYKIFPSLYTLRILNYFVFILMIYVFSLLVEKFSKDSWLLTLLVFLNPYFLMSSFVYYMYNWGPLFALAGLYFYQIKRSYFFTGFFMSMAVLSQQWMLVFILSILLHESILAMECKISFSRFMKYSLIICIFSAPVVVLFIKWSGLTHPNFSSHALHPSFEHLGSVLAHFGFILLFPVLENIRHFIVKKNIWLLFLLPLFWLSIPAYSMSSGLQQISGCFSYAAMLLNNYMNIPYKLTMFLFIIPGLFSIVFILKKTTADLFAVTNYFIIGFLIVLIASVRLTSAYVYICIPFLLLLLNSEIVNLKKMKILMIAQYLFVSCFYIVHIVFFRSKGIMF